TPLRLIPRIALTLALLFTLVGVGFAHRVPHPEDAGKLAFMLAGGTLADVCHDGGDDDTAGRDCPVCHLPTMVMVPPLDVPVLKAELAFVAKVVAPQTSRAARLVRDPGHGLRAPPLV
ncbi:MAG: hypothetical protein WCO04_18645, partial [Pseudomonadota bacterium]